jgi:hypothetical protein
MMEKMGDLYVSQTMVPEHRCPGCHILTNAVMALTTVEHSEPVIPHPGQLSICTCCNSVNVFQPDGSLRFATNEECETLPEWAKTQIMEQFTPVWLF